MMANFDDLFTTPAAPEPPSAPPQLTKEEYAAKKKAERDDLYALADEMAHEIMQDGDAFRGFLDVQARFDRYSPTNALLIYAQNDKATRLRDFDGWKKQGVYVRRHETGISILEAGDSYVTEDGRTGYYYHVKKVFDIAQTDAKRQPQIHYDDRLLLSALISKRPCPLKWRRMSQTVRPMTTTAEPSLSSVVWMDRTCFAACRWQWPVRSWTRRSTLTRRRMRSGAIASPICSAANMGWMPVDTISAACRNRCGMLIRRPFAVN